MVKKTTASDGIATAEPIMASDAAETSPEQRDEFASKLVEHFSLWSGLAGFIPLPLVDVAAVGGIQLQMLRRLSQIYNVPFSENGGKAFLASLAGTAIPASSGIGAASVLKVVPFVGAAVSALVMPALSSGATYVIGKVFIQHFASGGTLLDFNPPDYREFIKTQKEMWSTRPTATAPVDQKTAPPPTGASA